MCKHLLGNSKLKLKAFLVLEHIIIALFQLLILPKDLSEIHKDLSMAFLANTSHFIPKKYTSLTVCSTVLSFKVIL